MEERSGGSEGTAAGPMADAVDHTPRPAETPEGRGAAASYPNDHLGFVSGGNTETTGDHPWLRTPYGQRILRVALYTALAWLSLLALIGAVFGQGVGFHTLPDARFALWVLLAPPLFCAALAAAAQRWLTRYVPAVQSLLFGGLTYVVGILVATVVSAFESFGAAPCTADGGCLPAVGFSVAFAGFGLLPLLPAGAVGYGLALASVTTAGTRVFVATLTVAFAMLALFATAVVASLFGAG